MGRVKDITVEVTKDYKLSILFFTYNVSNISVYLIVCLILQ